MELASAVHQHTVLLVDDDKNILNAVISISKVDGYHMLTAQNAEEAIQFIICLPLEK